MGETDATSMAVGGGARAMADVEAAFGTYLGAVGAALARGDSTEHTHRPALKALVEALGGAGVVATNEPKRTACGAPDFIVARRGVPVGYVEAKDVGADLDAVERDAARTSPKTRDGAQLSRYLAALPSVILTDYLELRWYTEGVRRLAARLAMAGANGKLDEVTGGRERVRELVTAFLEAEAPVVRESDELARRMAAKARLLRETIRATFGGEMPEGPLHVQMLAFREALIPDLAPDEFSDMYAQTIAYGLFAARCATPGKRPFRREDSAYMLPKTNPFLRDLFVEIAGPKLDERVAWAVDDLALLLDRAEIALVLADFGRRTGREDPVVHFYETFLAAYDPRLREVRGVYYTPEPVVSWMVGAVDEILRDEFGRPEGLASKNTLILDPSCGTGTFLFEVVKRIHDALVRARRGGTWSGYVERHLLPRLFGFELLMAPYTVAHMKLGVLLAQTGYAFKSDERLRIFLTNTLEQAVRKVERLGFGGFVSEEGNAAAYVKTSERIEVVIGNPPYSGHSANASRREVTDPVTGARSRELTWIGGRIEDYRVCDGAPLGERNPKWLQNDYVKFIRFGQWRIEETGQGVLAFITDNSWLDGPTFRGMRQSLMKSFDEVYILDLHGNSRKKETCPDGSKDENVFDVTRQGVCIGVFVRRPRAKAETARGCVVRHAHLYGTRERKHRTLLKASKASLKSVKWTKLAPVSPAYWFVPRTRRRLGEYERGAKLTEIFPVNSVGIVTARDDLAMAFEEKDLRRRIAELRDEEKSDDQVRYALDLVNTKNWSVHSARAALRKDRNPARRIVPCLYRPFDERLLLYHPAAIERSRSDVMRHVLAGENVLITFPRSTSSGKPFDHVFCARSGVLGRFFPDSACITYMAPLYLYPDGDLPGTLFPHEDGRRPNLSDGFIADVASRTGLAFVTDGRGDMRRTFGPEDAFHYIYAVLHSPLYRERYGELLKADFPRIPLTSDGALFRKLCGLGRELVALHLLESPDLERIARPGFPEKGSCEVEEVCREEDSRRVFINRAQHFEGVPPEVWSFQLGSYRVCEKWLKDRRGRTLSHDEIERYRSIVAALGETLRLMSEIDRAVPGWPS